MNNHIIKVKFVNFAGCYFHICQLFSSFFFYLIVYLSICLSNCMSICRCNCLSIYLSICLSKSVVINLFKAATPSNSEFLLATHIFFFTHKQLSFSFKIHYWKLFELVDWLIWLCLITLTYFIWSNESVSTVYGLFKNLLWYF